MKFKDENTVVAIVGLGYVGLPLAIEFGKYLRTICFDIDRSKINAYRSHVDPAGEIEAEEMARAIYAHYTTNEYELSAADYIIIAVPTPIDCSKNPDLTPLKSATICVGKNMKKGAVIIYESTVYPGATEEVCIPLLEQQSKMHWKADFTVGYSPERINPGDKTHTLQNIVKIVSGDTEQTLDKISTLYEKIINAGVHRVSSIKVAEAAKIIENTQRDLNIALMNELAMIFDLINIDTKEVLEAAATKWNFIKFTPGLVGGHCIGVDPYYLTHKAQMLGYHPQVILAGRRINDGMSRFIAQATIKKMITNGSKIRDADIIILGLAFKENCSDIRNSLVFDLVAELREYGVNVHIADNCVDPELTRKMYNLELTEWIDLPIADAIIIAVAHDSYVQLSSDEIQQKLRAGGTIIDLKSICNVNEFHERGYSTWRL